MMTLGIDAHKRAHTVVVVDGAGRQLGQRTTSATTTAAHLELVRWADSFGSERMWAVEDCRHLSRRLKADLLTAGERIVRVPPKLMAHAGTLRVPTTSPIRSTRSLLARAAQRHPDLPVAQLDGPAHELRLIVDRREDPVKDGTGNRQLNCAIHRIAITRMRCHPDARDYLERRRQLGNTNTEALRALKRRLSDTVYRALLQDAQTTAATCIAHAA